MSDKLISIEEAIRIVHKTVGPHDVEKVSLADALHRRLAEPIATDIDQPPFDRSLMDGYAVRSADCARVPATLDLAGQIAAGATDLPRVGPGQAVQINTGALIPPGADAVVRIEATELIDGGRRVRVNETAAAGTFITPRGSYRAAGQRVLDSGTLMTPLELAAAAAAGATRLTVYRRPSVVILPTGSELVEPSRVPTGAQIRNSNELMLQSLVWTARGEAVTLDAVGDDPDATATMIERASSYDVLCITGGISMGAFDFVPGVLEAQGAEFLIRKIAIKPGRPTLFAKLPSGTLVFALPGNPVSAYVGFQLLVAAALDRLQGGDPPILPLIPAVLHGEAPAPGKRCGFRPVRARLDESGRWHATPLHWHGSGDVFGMATSNALLMRPPGSAPASDGDVVIILPTGGPSACA